MRRKGSAPQSNLPADALNLGYGRISEDRQEGAGVQDQHTDIKDMIVRQHWTGPFVYFEDNDISASKYARQRRPEYRRMLAQVQMSPRCRIIVAHIDRLYRLPKELEELIDLAESGRIEIFSVYSGPVDLTTSDGRAMARVQIAMAAKASDDTSRRVLRAIDRNREAGLPTGGDRPFGWRRITVTGWDGKERQTWDPLTHDESEAELIRQAVEDVIAGASVTSIARQWNQAGVPQPRAGRVNRKNGTNRPAGPRWTDISVRRILTSPRNAGLVALEREAEDDDGEKRTEIECRTAVWPAIIDRAKWERCREVLTQRAPHWANPRRRSLLTGILICGHCGASLTASVHSTRNPDGSARRVWRCSGKPGKVGQDGEQGCGRVSILAEPLEAHLTEHTFRQVDGSDVSKLMKARAANDRRSAELMRQVADIERRLQEATDSYGRPGGISLAVLERTTRALEAQKRELEAQFSNVGHTSVLWRYAGKPGALRAAWEKLPVETRNAAIREVRGKVAIMPATRHGRGAWDTGRILATDDGFLPVRMRPLADAG